MSDQRRIVLMVDALTVAQQQAFLEWLKAHGAGWAQWFAGGWLIAPAGSEPTVTDIQDKLQTFTPSPQHLVLEIEHPTAWAGAFDIPKIEAIKQWLRGQYKLNWVKD
jgi:hypothetical protein